MAFLVEFIPAPGTSECNLRRLGAGIARLLLEVRLRKSRRGRNIRQSPKRLPKDVQELLAGRKPDELIVLGFDLREERRFPKLRKDASGEELFRRFQQQMRDPPPASRDEMVRMARQFIPDDVVVDVVIDHQSWQEV